MLKEGEAENFTQASPGKKCILLHFQLDFAWQPSAHQIIVLLLQCVAVSCSALQDLLLRLLM